MTRSAVDVCEDCQRARQVADGEALALSPAASAMVECDVQRVDAHVGVDDNRASSRAKLARSDGGAHDASNLVTLCGAHHRAVHEGTLTVTGSADVDISFYHADGTPYGARPSASLMLVQTQAFQALRGLGFGEREIRAAMARPMKQAGSSPDLEPFLRRCLALLSERACR